VGREKETETLRECLAELQRGRGQIVTLIGEAGVGKSRLIAELKQTALAPPEEGLPPLWLEGRCLELSCECQLLALHRYVSRSSSAFRRKTTT